MILRKYNVAATIDGVPLVKRGSIDFKANPTLAAGDVKISKDGGAFANLTTLPAVTPASGEFVEIALSATEMQAARIAIKFIDQTAPKEWEDQAVLIETYGHASAAHEFDLDTASVAQTGDSFARIGATGSGLTTLASQASLDTLDNFVDTEVAAILAAVDTEIAALQADTDDIQARLPAALVGGRIDASVGAMATDVVTASSIAANAIGASEIAADAIAEIQGGLATSAALALAQGDVDDIQARLPAALVAGKMDSTVADIQAAAHAKLFSQNSGSTYAAAVAGSIVKEIVSNVSGGGGGGGAWSLDTSARVRVERPSSGTAAENIHLYVENASGAPIAADSLPTVTATAIGGVDQTANLGTVTSPQTGHYVVPYNVASTHPQPQGVYVEFTVIVGGVTKRVGVTFDVVSHNTTLGSLTTLITGVNVTRVQGTSLTTKVGSNFKFFFDNNDTITTKIVQDTGGTATIEVTLGAIMAVSVAGNRVAAPLILEMFQTEEKVFSFTVLDAAGAPVSYAGKTLRFTAWDSNDPPNAVFEVEGADVTITGAGSNVINVKVQPSKSTLANEELKFSLWDVTSAGHEPVITWGQLKILPAVKDV